MRKTLVTLGIVLAHLSSSFAKVAYADEEGAAPPPRGFTDPRVITGWSRWEPIAPGYHWSTRPRRGLVIAGVIVFGSAYLLSMLLAPLVSGFASFAGNTNTSVGALFVPGVGPFIEIGQSLGATASFYFALDGLAQLGGIAMIVAGLNVPKAVLVPNHYGASTGVQFSFVPIVAPGRQGLGLVGTF
jgi:hypothetical protein